MSNALGSLRKQIEKIMVNRPFVCFAFEPFCGIVLILHDCQILGEMMKQCPLERGIEERLFLLFDEKDAF